MRTCDICDEEKYLSHVAVQPRPSDPTEIVVIMEACKECGMESEFLGREQVRKAFFDWHEEHDDKMAKLLGIDDMVKRALFLSL